jgi:ketopantoate reductase
MWSGDYDGALAEIEGALAISPNLTIAVGMINAELSLEGAVAFRLAMDNHISFGELDGQRSARCLEIQRAFAAGAVPAAVSDRIAAEMRAKFCG